MKNVFFAIGCILLFTSCNRNPFKVNLTDTTINFQFHAFGSDLFAAKDKLSEQLPELEKTYPDILPLFSSEIIAIGLPEDDGFEELLNSFVEDSLMQVNTSGTAFSGK